MGGNIGEEISLVDFLKSSKLPNLNPINISSIQYINNSYYMVIHVLFHICMCGIIDESLITSSVAITTDHTQPMLPDSGVDTEGLSCVFT